MYNVTIMIFIIFRTAYWLKWVDLLEKEIAFTINDIWYMAFFQTSDKGCDDFRVKAKATRRRPNISLCYKA